MKLKFTPFLLLLLIIGMVNTCKKDDQKNEVLTPTSIPKLVQNIQIKKAGPPAEANGSLTFTYNAKYCLEKTVFKMDNESEYVEELEYDEQGNFIQAKILKDGILDESFAFRYSADHILIDQICYSEQGNTSFLYEIKVDEAVKPLAIRVLERTNEEMLLLKSFYFEMNSQELIKASDSIQYEYSGEIIDYVNTTNYTYDQSINPFGTVSGQHPLYQIYRMFSPIQLGYVNKRYTPNYFEGFSENHNRTNNHYTFYTGMSSNPMFNSLDYKFDYKYGEDKYPTELAVSHKNDRHTDLNWNAQMTFTYNK